MAAFNHVGWLVSLRGSTNKDLLNFERLQIFTSHSLSLFVSDSLNATPKRMLWKNQNKKQKQKSKQNKIRKGKKS